MSNEKTFEEIWRCRHCGKVGERFESCPDCRDAYMPEWMIKKVKKAEEVKETTFSLDELYELEAQGILVREKTNRPMPIENRDKPVRFRRNTGSNSSPLKPVAKKQKKKAKAASSTSSESVSNWYQDWEDEKEEREGGIYGRQQK